jgi:hypothetical protein
VKDSSRAALAFAIADSFTAFASAIASFKNSLFIFPKFFCLETTFIKSNVMGDL